jgi:hypothetical protein
MRGVVRRVVVGVLAGLAVGLLGAAWSGGAGAAADGPRASAAARAVPVRGAVKLAAPDGRPLAGRWQGYADASLMPTVPGRVKVILSGCPARRGAAGCVYTKRPRVIYLRRGLNDPRGVLLHELGHLYDIRVLNNRDRARFRRILGRSAKRQWWRGSRPLAELFAEAYSWCARYARIVSISRYSSYAYRPTARQHRAICALILKVALDRAPAVPAPKAPTVTGPHAPPPPPPSTDPGVVPGDPERDPGPQPAEDPEEPPEDGGGGGGGVPLPPPPAPTPTPPPPPVVPPVPPPPGLPL